MSGSDVKGRIGFEDLNTGYGSFNRRNSSGGLETLTRVNQLVPHIFDVKDYGAKGDNSANDTTALQNAINDCLAFGGGIVDIPPGTYRFSALTITGSKNIQIRGAGMGTTILANTSSTGNSITIQLDQPNRVEMHNMEITMASGVTKTSGAAIRVEDLDGDSTNVASEFIRLDIKYHYIGIDFYTATYWKVDRCFFGFYFHGIEVRNVSNPDGGDSVITNNNFNSATASHVAIAHYSSGGLRVINNKFLGGNVGNTAYAISLETGSTGIMYFCNNSVEAFTYGVLMQQQEVGGGPAARININDNQFDGITSGGTCVAQTGDDWLTQLIITGNIFASPANVAGVNIEGAEHCYIGGNEFIGVGSNNKGILIGANADVHIGPNGFHNITTQLTDLSANTKRAAPLDYVKLTSFTPTFNTSVGDGDIGNGTITGTYRRFGNMIHAVVNFTAGATTDFGSGNLRIGGFPVAAVGSFFQLGHCLMYESGGNVYTGVCQIGSGVTYVSLGSDGIAPWANATTPFAWGAGDQIQLQISYHIAES